LEGQILHYYLKIFSLILIIFLTFVLLYSFYILNKKNIAVNKTMVITKNENLSTILHKNFKNIAPYELLIMKLYYKINNSFTDRFIHYGNFYINEKLSFISLLNIVSQPSNIIKKITIVDGWSHSQFNEEVSKLFTETYIVPYKNILADTYFLENNTKFESLIEKLINSKKQYFNKFKNHNILKSYSVDEIMIIGSLIEKEGLDSQDKRKISSVIFNRLNKNMLLQIDATVLFAITNGDYNLKRKLLISDLKYEHPYNTYLYRGLPPEPISYVGRNTLDLIFENYKSDFLFYFFNKSLNRHIFSTNFKDHKKKLNEYRKNQ